MKRIKWLLVAWVVALSLAGCDGGDSSSTGKTPPPAVEVAPSATNAAVLPEVQTGANGGSSVSPLATPDNGSPLPAPTSTPVQ